jgi:hypothetical protein
MMPKRDNYTTPLSEKRQSPFCGFLVQKHLVPQDKAKCFVAVAA